MEAVQPLADRCKGQSSHRACCDGKRCGWRKNADVPRSDVKVPSTGPVVTAVHHGSGLAQVSSHDAQGRVAHRKRKTNVTDHWSNEVTVIAGPRTRIRGCVLLPNQWCGGSDDAFLPRGTEALASETCAVWRFAPFGVQHLQGLIEGSSPCHETLPLQATIQGRRHIMRQRRKVRRRSMSTRVRRRPR